MPDRALKAETSIRQLEWVARRSLLRRVAVRLRSVGCAVAECGA
jgi:hypothetical protein